MGWLSRSGMEDVQDLYCRTEWWNLRQRDLRLTESHSGGRVVALPLPFLRFLQAVVEEEWVAMQKMHLWPTSDTWRKQHCQKVRSSTTFQHVWQLFKLPSRVNGNRCRTKRAVHLEKVRNYCATSVWMKRVVVLCVDRLAKGWRD